MLPTAANGSALRSGTIREIYTGILDADGADIWRTPRPTHGEPPTWGFRSNRRRPKVASIPGPSDASLIAARVRQCAAGVPVAQVEVPAADVTPGPADARPKISAKGIETEFFTIGQLATAVHRSKYTVVDWIRRASCPSPATEPRCTEHRWGKGVRLWSRAQVEGIQRIAREEGILGEQRRRRQIRSAAHQRFANGPAS